MFKARLLQAAQNYEAMFNVLFKSADPKRQKIVDYYKKYVADEIRWAKKDLKNSEWITWYLRILRAVLLLARIQDLPGEDDPDYPAIKAAYDKALGGLGMTPRELPHRMQDLQRSLAHFLSLQSKAIQDYRPGNKKPQEVLSELESLEQEWIASRKSILTPRGEDEILINLGGGWAWWKLGRHYCPDEAKAMGHCGNEPGDRSERILSLRKEKGDGEWEPYCTFILHEDGMIGEMKGRGNTKPAARYFPAIIELLKNPIVKGIIGGGYKPENNFDIMDLPEKDREALYELKPALMPLRDYYKKFGADENFVKQMESYLDSVDQNNISWEWNGKEFVGPFYDDLADCIQNIGDNQAKRVLDFYEGTSDPEIDWEVSEKDLLEDLPADEIEMIGETLKAIHADELPKFLDIMREEDEEEYEDEEEAANSYYFDTKDAAQIIAFAEMVNDPLIYNLSDAARAGFEIKYSEEVKELLTEYVESFGFQEGDNGTWYGSVSPGEALNLKEDAEEPPAFDQSSWSSGAFRDFEPSYSFDTKAAIDAFHGEYNVKEKFEKALGPDGVKAFREKKDKDKRYKEEYKRILEPMRAYLKEHPEQAEQARELDRALKDGDYEPLANFARKIIPDAFRFDKTASRMHWLLCPKSVANRHASQPGLRACGWL